MAFLVIAHSHRSEPIPHWLHSATMELLEKPCHYVNLHESHAFDIGESRNELARVALSLEQTTHILFVDDDIIIPDRKCLMRMFESLQKGEVSILSGLYYGKLPPHPPMIMDMEIIDGLPSLTFPFADREIPKDTLVRVGCVPAGFLLVKRQVLEAVGKPYFVYHAPELSQRLPEGENPPGEDVYFSLKARRAGFELFVDTRADLLHYVPTFVGNPKLIEEVTGTGADHTAKLVKRLEQQMSELEKTHSKT